MRMKTDAECLCYNNLFEEVILLPSLAQSRSSQILLDLCPSQPVLGRSQKGTTNGEADGVYGWYRYIQDFTGAFAEGWIGKTFEKGDLIWDPFMGSGTTLLACKHLGLRSTGYDVSPFMVDVVRAKIDWSISPEAVLDALGRVEHLLDRTEPDSEELTTWDEFENLAAGSTQFEGDKKLRKWISPHVVERLVRLTTAVDAIEDAKVRSFLRLGVAGILVPCSNMALRPNICYRAKPVVDFPVKKEFGTRVRRMIDDLRELDSRNKISTTAQLGDARSVGPSKADGIFTSPPYPNDMEYVHQTRLELALLSYVSDRKELTILKKSMISSSVKLVYRENEWQKNLGLEVEAVSEVYGKLKETLEGKNWGWNAADMAAQYFGGMRSVMRNWNQRLRPGAIAAVVVGDSAFNGIKLPTDTILGSCSEAEGFDIEDIDVFRTRWNSKHTEALRESVLVLRKRSAS